MSVPGLQPHFNAWVASDPDLPFARVGRAHYYAALGWKDRGTDWAKNTSDSSFARMQRWYERQLTDLLHVLERDSTNMQALVLMAMSSRALGDTAAMHIYLRAGLEVSPHSYVVRRYYLTEILRPRWHGSHEEMRRFALHAQRFTANNPRLRVLLGFPSWDEGVALGESHDTAGALAKYDDALSFGDAGFVRMQRARVHYGRRERHLAIADLTCAIAYAPQNGEALALRAMARLLIAENDSSSAGRELRRLGGADLRLAQRLDPEDGTVIWALRFQSRFFPSSR